ncbi:MAG: hypothetical protein NTY07_07585 [Bacteroidia bacterium]|nr:hypothetical protein [Bacteroidia bacterium]
MKTLKFNILVAVVLLISLNVNAEKVSKRVYKNYPVNAVHKLDLNNKYGNIYIENNRTDSVIVSADIWVEGSSDRAKRLLDGINVSVNLNGSTVVAITEIESMQNWNTEFSIDYHISVPADRELEVVQKYGNVNMKDLTAKGTFEIKYGALNGQKLLSPDLSMDIAYSKVNVVETKDLSLVLSYSKLKLEKANNLKLETRYSGVIIDKCKQIDANSKYDNYSIQNMNTLIINSMYTGVTVDKLTEKLSLINGYGGVTIKEIPAGFESITVESKYAGIKLGIASDAAYKLNGKVRYSDIKHPDGKLNRMRENTSYEVNGIIGNSENPKSSVRIESSYGSVNLIQ